MTIQITIGGAPHGAVRLDKVKAVKTGTLASVVHTQDLDNGAFVQLGSLVEGQREQFAVKVPDANSINTDSLYLHADDELNYYIGQQILDYTLPAGKAGRTYLLEAGDIVTITNNMLTPNGEAAIAVGDFVAPVAGSLLLSDVGTTEPTTRFVGQVIETTTIYGEPATAILVLKN